MATVKFNILDKVIAKRRLSMVVKEIRKYDIVLDMGCGSQGYLLRSVAHKICFGLGLDREVEEGQIGNLEFKKYFFNKKLDLESGYFDKVVMLAVLEHIDPKMVSKLFSEFGRVLKKDGRIILTTPTPRSKKILEYMAKIGLINKEEIADHKKYYRKSDLEKICKDSGLKLVSYKLFQLGLNSVCIFKKS